MKLNIGKFNQYYNYKYIDDRLYIISKKSNKEKEVRLNQNIYLCYEIDEPKNKKEVDELLEKVDEFIEKGVIQKINVNDLYKDLLGLSEEQLFLKINGYSKKSGDYIDKLLKEINFVDVKTSKDSIENKFYIGILGALNFHDARNLNRKLGLYKIPNDMFVAQHLINYIDDYDYIQHFYSKEPNMEIFDRTEFLFEIDTFLRDNFYIDNLEFIKGVHWTELEGSLEDKFKALKNNKKIHICNQDAY